MAFDYIQFFEFLAHIQIWDGLKKLNQDLHFVLIN